MRCLMLSLLVVFTSAVVSLQSCRPLMRQEPVNEAERVVSNASNLQVFATKGKERGFCMVKSRLGGSDRDVELLTTDGSLSDKQLELILNSLNVWENLSFVTSLVAALGGFVGGVLTIPISSKMGVSMIAMFSMGGITLNSTAQHRDARLRRVISDAEEQVFDEKHMQKFINSLRSTKPAHEGGCDHVKNEIKSAAQEK